MHEVEDVSLPPKIVQLSKFFGLINEGWTLEDYMVDAVKRGGYETVNLWGVQGAGKSCRMLQIGYWIYKDWDTVLKNIVFKPNEFVKRLREVPSGERIPCLLWDDIGVHYTSTTFRTNVQQYEAIDATWAAIRTKCNVIVLTIPLIDRLAKNIKDNITFEVFIGKNQMEYVQRLVRLPGIGTVESNLFKITIEEPAVFDLHAVPEDVFKQYWKMRLQLTEEALDRLDMTIAPEDMEHYVPVAEAAVKLGMSANTLQSYISRGVYEGRKIKGILCLTKEAYESLKKNRWQMGRRARRHAANAEGYPVLPGP